MHFQSLKVFALLEFRTLFKLVRSWVIVLVSLGISTTFFVLVTWHHVSFSHRTIGLGSLGPRYSAATLAIYFIAVFTAGVVLSSMEIRTRDQRAQMFEVIATRPVSNIEIFIGRLGGVLVFFAVPMLVFLGLITVYGSFCQLVGISYGEPIAFWSVLSVAVLDVGPNLLLVGSVTVLFSMILRSRLAAAALTLMLVAIGMWLHFRFPHFVTAPFQTITANVLFPSEIAPQFMSLGVLSNRVALVVLSLGFLCIAGALLPRITTRRPFNLQSGAGLVLVGLLIFCGHFTVSERGKQQLKNWSGVHQQPSADSFPDIVQLGGSVDIYPGNSITFDFQLMVVAPEDNPSDWVIFSLNPGYRLDSILLNGVSLARQSDFDFKDGLLRVNKKVFEGESVTLNISGRGRPNLSFAYLDTPAEVRHIVGPATRRLYHMGTENSIFHSRYVALLAATKWYPVSGSSWQEWNLDQRVRDFFEVDLTVSVPRNWIVAGPGHREVVGEERRAKFRFAPKLPVPEVALVGSNFVRRAITVSGVEFELLISPKHQQMFRPLTEFAQDERLSSWVAQEIEQTREQTGLEYPHSILSFVEVPAQLRTYGSGWQLDSTLSAPGIIMLRETGLPTARFESWSDDMYVESDSESWNLDRQIASFHVHQLLNFIAFDAQGETPTIGFRRQLFEYQTAPTGSGANVLKFTLTRAIMDRHSVFPSAYSSFWDCMNPTYAELFSINGLWSRERNLRELHAHFFTSRDSLSHTATIWEFLEQHSLADLDTVVDPRVVHGALMAKTQQVLLTLPQSQHLDGTPTGITLEADLLSEYRGTTFLFEEFLEIAFGEQESSKDESRAWISQRGLPGYQIGDSKVEHRVDEEAGIFAYINTFKLRNTQPIPGWVVVAWDVSPETNPGTYFPDYEYSLFSVAGEQSYLVAKKSTVPLERAWVKTGLSLNRDSVLRLDLTGTPDTSHGPIVEPPQSTPTEWMPPLEQGIVVDDLDPGFSIEHHVEPPLPSRVLKFVWGLFSRPKLEWDYGLPVMQYDMQEDDEVTTNGVWAREFGQLGFGRYRHTYTQFVLGAVPLRNMIEDRRATRATVGKHNNKIASARFSAYLPHSGDWQLSYYLPFETTPTSAFERPFRSFLDLGTTGPHHYLSDLDLGKVTLEIHAGSEIFSAEIDYAEAHSGWNVIGVYEFEPTNVDVYVSNVTDGEIVIADAIRWLPVPTEE